MNENTTTKDPDLIFDIVIKYIAIVIHELSNVYDRSESMILEYIKEILDSA